MPLHHFSDSKNSDFLSVILQHKIKTVKPPLKVLWAAMDFNTKLRKVLNRGNLMVRLLTWDHRKWTLNEGGKLRDIKWGVTVFILYYTVMSNSFYITWNHFHEGQFPVSKIGHFAFNVEQRVDIWNRKQNYPRWDKHCHTQNAEIKNVLRNRSHVSTAVKTGLCGLVSGYQHFRWICYTYPEAGSSKILVTNYKTACRHQEDHNVNILYISYSNTVTILLLFREILETQPQLVL
jgi:hypothetical protein